MTTALVEAVRSHWGWAGIEPAQVTAISPFGHLVLRDRQGAFWYLDLELRTLDRIAEDETGLFAHMGDPEVREMWQADALVTRAKDKLGAAPEGHCYSLSIPALLEGNYASDDFWLPPVTELIACMGDIERQIRNLPDGSNITLKLVD